MLATTTGRRHRHRRRRRHVSCIRHHFCSKSNYFLFCWTGDEREVFISWLRKCLGRGSTSLLPLSLSHSHSPLSLSLQIMLILCFIQTGQIFNNF